MIKAKKVKKKIGSIFYGEETSFLGLHISMDSDQSSVGSHCDFNQRSI
jgi:hypothetical protein